ncbi:MAG: hypothetical protein KAW17_04085 [Candidatus Eisenbacteria sp.]|nr:hypothetical protein [Candidatus Eisenbacteria bacterium]
MSGHEIQSWLEEFLSSKSWLSKRYSPKRVARALEKWVDLFREEAEALDIPEEEITPLRYFRPSYLRLSQNRSDETRLRSRARDAAERISKWRLLRKARRTHGIEGLDTARLEKWSHHRIAFRFSAWEKAILQAAPGLQEEEMFRFFRLRYLYLPEERFLKQAIPLGVKNTVGYHKRIALLGCLGITPDHPEYEQWLPMPEWQFQRKARKLQQALERFWNLDLGFPPTSNSLNQKDYRRYLQICARGDHPEVLEEMIYKLVLYFGILTHEQLAGFLSGAPEDSPWRSYNFGSAVGTLVELGLVEEQMRDSGALYQPSRSIQTELILETWLGKLRSQITIGTQEALDYLPAGYQRHGTSVIAGKDIPRATEKIMRDRRRMISELCIDRNDPRHSRLLGLSRRDIESRLADYRSVVQDLETHRLMIPPELEQQMDIFYEDDLKPGDRNIFALVVSLESVSLSQMSKILRRHNGSRRGFAIKSSLKRLCAVELLAEDQSGLYTLHPSLEDLDKTETESVVGFL